MAGGVRGTGPVEDVARQWAGFTPMSLDGLDEQWRDTSIWLVGGQARLFDLRTFYHHLREECGADADRIRRVKKVLARVRTAAFDLQASLSYCSPLGLLLRGVRRLLRDHEGPVAGEGTLRRLEAAGCRTLADVARLDVAEMTGLGVRLEFAKQIRR